VTDEIAKPVRHDFPSTVVKDVDNWLDDIVDEIGKFGTIVDEAVVVNLLNMKEVDEDVFDRLFIEGAKVAVLVWVTLFWIVD
jgi:hypothetical protein